MGNNGVAVGRPMGVTEEGRLPWIGDSEIPMWAHMAFLPTFMYITLRVTFHVRDDDRLQLLVWYSVYIVYSIKYSII